MDSYDSEPTSSSWGWWVLGIALILLGIVALGSVLTTSAVSILLLGWLLLIVGIVQFFAGFFVSAHKLSTVLLGVLWAIAGVFIIANPGVSLATLTLVLAVALTIGGLVRLIASFGDEGTNRGWRIFGSLVTLLLGIMVWAGWPESSFYIFGIFIGIDLVIGGIASIAVAMSNRRVHRLA